MKRRSGRVASQWLAALVCIASGAGPLACSRSASSTADAGSKPDATAEAGSADGGASDADGEPALADAGTLVLSRDSGTPIGPLAFGQNYWDWVDWANDGVTGLTGTQALVASLDVNVLRAGGSNNDMNGPTPAVFDTAQLDAFVAYCRAVGAEPILQVPVLADVDGGAATAQTAADMVTYANVTRGYGIRYWEIGNEPDIYSLDYDAGVPLTPQDLCAVYRQYVPAMRTANAAAGDAGATMTILGPELAYQYGASGQDYLSPFLDACQDEIDVVSVHRYPFSGAQTSIPGALDDVVSFRQAIAEVQSTVQAHARPDMPIAMTEANISYDYQPSAYTAASSVAAPGTFYAALWTADVLGASLESHLWTLAFWDLGDAITAPSVLGFLQQAAPVPAYYTMQMISAHFRGATVVPSGVPSGFSAYASYDAAGGATQVLVLNKTAPASTLAVAIDGLPVQSFAAPRLSATLVTIPDAPGAATHVLRYTQDQADAGTGPVIVQ